MTTAAPAIEWEQAIAAFLGELAAVQTRILAALSNKREKMATGDLDGMEAASADEESLTLDLRRCHERRETLLQSARAAGLPAADIRTLAAAVAGGSDSNLTQETQQVARSLRLLNHECLTNFVLAQRTWLHLTQLVEIIATGGRPKPTYGKEESQNHRGALVDRVA